MKLASVVLLASASSALAAPATTWTVSVKVGDGAKRTLVPVAKVTRAADGKVSVAGVPAPSLDKIADDAVAAWKAYTPGASISITDTISSNTGMRPDPQPHTVVFTKADPLYGAAAVRAFGEKYGYDILGIRAIRFVDYDTSAESPPGARDRASTHSNFRKGTKLAYDSGGSASFFVRKRIRAANHGEPLSVLRVSASDKKLAVEQDQDDGLLDAMYLHLFPDGHADATPVHATQQLVERFPNTFAPEDVDVSVIVNADDYKSLHVDKKSPKLVEAQLVQYYEHGQFYAVTPVIDPAIFR